MTLISVLVALIVIGLIFWVVRTLAPVMGIPEPIVTIIYVILVVLIAIWLLQMLQGGGLSLRLR